MLLKSVFTITIAMLFVTAIIYFRSEAPAWQKNARSRARKFKNINERVKEQKVASQLLQR